MHEIEAELKKALKFKGKYEDRQELLTAILLAMDDRKRFTDKDYDALTDDAVSWFEAAVKAKDSGDEIPDFDGELAEVDHEADEAAEFAEEDPDDASDESDATADDDGDVDEEDGNEDEETEAVAEASIDEDQDDKSDGSGADRPSGDDTEDEGLEEHDDEVEVEEPEDTEEQILKKAKKIAKQAPKPAPKSAPEKSVKAKPTPQKAAPKPKPVQKGTFPEPDYENISGKRNRFGIIDGTKTAEAIKMYVKGASSQDIMERLGGRYYNILKKLMAEGHKVEKEGSVWKLTHKDDVKTKKKVK